MSSTLLFAAVVCAAILAVLHDYYRQPILAGTLFILLWQLMEVAGPNLVLAAALIVVAGFIKLVLEDAAAAEADTTFLVTLLDALLPAADAPRRNDREHRVWRDQPEEPGDDQRQHRIWTDHTRGQDHETGNDR